MALLFLLCYKMVNVNVKVYLLLRKIEMMSLHYLKQEEQKVVHYHDT